LSPIDLVHIGFTQGSMKSEKFMGSFGTDFDRGVG